MKIPHILQKISQDLSSKNAKAIIVGGAVRDHFLGLQSKDYDVEVYAIADLDALASLLWEYGTVNLVGKSFGVLKLVYHSEVYDFSLPRTETKSGTGHKGFDVTVDASLPYEVAAKRRDFKINALGYDIENNRFLDPFGGLEDIKNKSLSHIDDSTFMEDPLRVYRAVQFCARFGFELAENTKNLCKKMVHDGMLEALPKARIYEEWKKLLLKSARPSVGFELMRELGILKLYFPELDALIGIPQSPKWHPEGDVWVHTMMALDAMALEIADMDSKQKLKFLFAILCHDLGKATHTTIDDNGDIRAIGHENASIALSENLLYRLTDEHHFIAQILPLVEHHLKPSQFYSSKAKSAAFRRLATKVNIEELVIVAKADFLGRTTKESMDGVYHAGEWMLQNAKTLNISQKPLPALLQGRDLIALGLEPSPKFKEILDEVYRMQLEDKIASKDEAIAFVKRRYF